MFFLALKINLNIMNSLKYNKNLMPAKKQDFKESYERLQEISEILDSQEIIDIDQLIKLQEEAKKLYTFCNKKLKDLDKKLDSNEKE